MVWWRGLLVYVGAATLSIMVGLLVGRIVFKVSTWYFSRRRKTSISNHRPIKLDILGKDSHNNYFEDVQNTILTAKSEGQSRNLAQEDKHPVTAGGINLRPESPPQDTIKPLVWKLVRGEVKRAQKQEKITTGIAWGDKEPIVKSQFETERETWKNAGHKTQQIQRQKSRVLKIKAVREAVDQVSINKPLLVSKEEVKQALKNTEAQAKQKAMIPTQENYQKKTELAESARRFEEAKAEIQIEIERLSRKEAVQISGKVIKKAGQAAESVRKTRKVVTPSVSGQTTGLNEIETNLRIATTPWDGKPLPFQTKVWDTKINEFDSLATEHRNDLGQAYIDIAMANQIVWLCTEIGYTNDDLENSYKQLCTKIAERLATVCDKRQATHHA